MPEFVNTGKGMQLIETNNASQVPFQQGNLIIEDSGSIYYDPTNKTDVSGRITVGKADEIIDLGDISNIFSLDGKTSTGIYKYRFEYKSSPVSMTTDGYLIVCEFVGGNDTLQVRFDYEGINMRIYEAAEGGGAWIKIATSEDLPKVIDALTSTNPTKDALSVNQGIILDSKIDDISEELTTHANKNATTAEKGHVQLVNDLITGGTDKALTAEQGKQLKTALDSIELVESLGAVTSPLVSADTFKDVTAPGIYNFTSGGEFGYLIVGGQNNSVQTTQYLFLDSDFYSRESTSASSWSAWNKCLQAADIINNLTSGGTDVPLSAQMGQKLNTDKADKATTLAGYNIGDAYTKSEIDTKLSSVYKYIGSVTVEQLPQNLTASDKGNVYNLTNDGTINASTEHEETVVAGDNVAWTGDYWDKLAGTIDVEPSISEYDTIITSQVEWDTMVASPTWNDAVNILLKVDRITNGTATIPNNVKKIVGCPTNNSRPYIVGSLTGSNDGNVAYPNNVSLFNINIDMGNNLSNVNLVENCLITGKLSNFNTAINTRSGGYTNGQNIFNCVMINGSTTVNNVKCIVGLECIDIANNLKPIQYIDCEYVIEPTGELSKLTTTAKTDLVSAINELVTEIGDIKDLGEQSTYWKNDSSLFENVTGEGIYKWYTYNDSFGSVSGMLFTTGTADQMQIIFDSMGYFAKRSFIGAGGGSEWQIIGSSKKYSTVVIGNSASGLTANDVDYLYTAGSDFSTTLTDAINALPSTGGGEIKILGGNYTLSTPVEASGTLLKQIKITGEGTSTFIISDTPESHYINASYCEISECRLETDIRITTKGYVNIHDCEIAERIYFNNSSTLQDVFIHDNNLDYATTGKDFLYLSGAGSIYNFQVYNNYGDDGPFNFLYAAATKYIYSSSIRNNHCPYGTWSSSTYNLIANSSSYSRSTMTGNTFYSINFSGNYWCISNNHITYDLYLYNGDYLDVMNNRVDGTFTIASGLTYANITGNMIDAVATTSPYVNLGTNARFVNNTIRDTNFSTTYLPGHDTASNKWGNNMWANGFDRLVFANEEEIGGHNSNN